MFPNNVLSTQAVVRGFIDPVREPDDFLLDYERGGFNLNDATGGLSNKIWTLRGVRNAVTGLVDLRVSAEGSPTTTLLSGDDITEASLAFDQNMNPFVAYVQTGQAKFWWFDSVAGMMVVTNLPAGSSSPRCCLDERRGQNVSNSDIVLSYIRAGGLYFRLQRERYLVERELLTGLGVDAQLVDLGMNQSLRMQWRLRGATSNPEAAVNAAPYLATVVQNISRRSGIAPEAIDVADLYDDFVEGIKINVNEGLDKPIQELRDVFHFDKSEYDRKIRYLKRGRDVVVRIPYDDLVRGNPTALKMTIRDEAKLPRIVHINHLDPAGGYAKNKQTAQRRSNLVKAKGTKTIESGVVLTADQAATAAWTWLKKEWAELITYEFATSIKYTELVPTDVIEVEDSRGDWHRMRIEERNDEGREIEWTAKQDAGPRIYGSPRVGNSLDTPISTTPGLVGETQLEILNIPVMRDQDDLLGLYIAAAGASSAWTGYTLYISTDGGLSYVEAFTATQPSVIGLTETDLEEEVSYEYQADQTLDVDVNFPLSSISYDQLLANQNRAVVGDEVIQFQTATLLGQVGGRYQYRLSGLVRARYSTTPAFWPLGTRFVLLDNTVIFVQAQQWMLGVDLAYKPVTIGATEDETIATFYLYDEGVGQTEWPVSNVEVERDGSDNVTVRWIGAARLGFDSAPYHSAHFAGYRVKFDNGFTIDTFDQTATYASAPAGIEVQVCALNSITGEGPYSALFPT